MDDSGGAAEFRLKAAEEEDRLSALPDSLIHYILSLLPSTKQAIQTGILSKRWLNQWTLVPNLIFDFSGMSFDQCPNSVSHSTETISRIIDRTLLLHDCSKIQKFHIISKKHYDLAQDPNCDVKLRFVIRKQVEELVLDFDTEEEFIELPDFFFRQALLVKLELHGCSIMPIGIVYLPCLRDLLLVDCHYNDQAIGSILSGSPLLESLEMQYPNLDNPLVISSKSIKRLFLLEIGCSFDICCPNLVEFEGQETSNSLGVEALEKILSDCPLLESFTFMNYECLDIRISSKCLKKLAFYDVRFHEIEISCPVLEDLELSDLDAESIRLMNLPSSVAAALDFRCSKGSKENVAVQIFEQLQHVRDLKLGGSFVWVLSDRMMAGLSCPVLNGKALSLKGSVELIPGIVSALCSSPVLERLVVKLQPVEGQKLGGFSGTDRLENYWDDPHFSSVVSHLKTVKIMGLSRREENPKAELDFVEFLLENAIFLKKVSITLGDCEADFAVEVSQKLISFQRRSNALLELSCSKNN